MGGRRSTATLRLPRADQSFSLSFPFCSSFHALYLLSLKPFAYLTSISAVLPQTKHAWAGDDLQLHLDSLERTNHSCCPFRSVLFLPLCGIFIVASQFAFPSFVQPTGEARVGGRRSTATLRLPRAEEPRGGVGGGRAAEVGGGIRRRGGGALGSIYIYIT